VTRALGPRIEGEDGTILLLSLGLLAVIVGLVVTVVEASAVFLARRDVASVCDTAATAAAQRVDESGVYDGTDGTAARSTHADTARLPLTPAEVGPAAAAAARAADPDVRVEATAAGATVRITCERTVPLPLGRLVGIGPVTVTAGADADTPLR